jgi:hypothetical protein
VTNTCAHSLSDRKAFGSFLACCDENAHLKWRLSWPMTRCGVFVKCSVAPGGIVLALATDNISLPGQSNSQRASRTFEANIGTHEWRTRGLEFPIVSETPVQAEMEIPTPTRSSDVTGRVVSGL